MKYLFSSLMFACCLLLAGCGGNQPASNEIPGGLTKADLMNHNKNANATAGAPAEDPIARAEREAQAAAQAQAQAQAGVTQERRMPQFLDGRGNIADLPAYEKANLFNVQYGPVEGVDSARVIYMTSDSFDKVVAYYDRAIKSHRWTVVTNSREPETAEMRLAKGDRDEALVRVVKNNDTKQTEILLVRSQRPPENNAAGKSN